MAEFLIGFARPASMSEAEMRSWIEQRGGAGQPGLALGRARGADDHEHLWVTATADAVSTVEDQIADLILDMRLLGLRPTVMATDGGVAPPATA